MKTIKYINKIDYINIKLSVSINADTISRVRILFWRNRLIIKFFLCNRKISLFHGII